MAYDDHGNHWEVDPLQKMREHNKRVQLSAQRRNERALDARRENSIVCVAAPSEGKAKLPAVISGIVEKAKGISLKVSMFQFCLQIGTLKVEIRRDVANKHV